VKRDVSIEPTVATSGVWRYASFRVNIVLTNEQAKVSVGCWSWLEPQIKLLFKMAVPRRDNLIFDT